MSIHVRNLTKRFSNFTAVDDVSLEVDTGELVAFLGPSGSGKSTILRVIAGLETADTGQVWFNGERADHLHARSRGVGFVFQHYALFRHMTVAENIAFGLDVQRAKRGRKAKRVGDLLELMGLQGLGERYPGQLSGGQRQRVALARALAPEPKVLLLDEPFGALDTKVRKELRRWLRRLHDDMHISSVFVTHDQEEALEVADRVVVMNHGKIEQIGSPDEVYSSPASPFVYQFLGNVNVFHSRVQGGYAEVECREKPERATAFVRPHDIDITHSIAEGSLEATVQHVHPIGPVVRIELLHGREIVEVELSRERHEALQLAVGQGVWFRPRQLRVFGADNQPAVASEKQAFLF